MPIIHLKTYLQSQLSRKVLTAEELKSNIEQKKKALIMAEVVSVPPGRVGEDGETLLDHNVGPGHGAVQTRTTHLQ
jgi:hypothetical protein